MAHLRVMSLDRQMIVNNTGINQIIRCGSESESLGGLFDELTSVLDDILCVTMNEGQTSESSESDVVQLNFIRDLEELMKIPMLRFSNVCSSMEVRDCLVIHELQRFLGSYMYFVVKKALHPEQGSFNLLPFAQDRKSVV